MSNLQRGYLPNGKDRQHPVQDPYAKILDTLTPQLWHNPGTRTWYITVGQTTDFPPTVIPSDPVPE